MRTKILIFALMLSCYTGFAQQDVQFTQYMYNTININPAYAGSRGVMSIFGMHRTQWVGVDGAPVSNAFSLNTPLNDSRLGLGVSLVNDKIGPTNNTNVSGDFSYTIPTSERYKLSFGLKVSANMFDLDVTKLNIDDETDPNLQNFNNEITPNFGVGVYFHSDKLYLGLSVPSIARNTKYSDNDVAVYKERENFYFIGGYVFDLSQSVKFKPAVLTKMVTGSPLQVDLSANFMFFDKFALGAAYRWDAAFSALAGFQVSDGLYIGYAYDMETTELQNYNSGSHEIFLRYELFNKVSKMVSPRFF
jgi:type IX secretion system PorP/SprF family membrane protein